MPTLLRILSWGWQFWYQESISLSFSALALSQKAEKWFESLAKCHGELGCGDCTTMHGFAWDIFYFSFSDIAWTQVPNPFDFFFLPLTSFEVPILSNFVDFPFIVKSVLQTKEKFEKLLLCDVEGMDKDRLSVRRLGQFFLKWTKTVIDFQTWRLSLSKNKNKNKHTNKKGVQKAVGRWSWKKTHLEFSWEISKSNHE